VSGSGETPVASEPGKWPAPKVDKDKADQPIFLLQTCHGTPMEAEHEPPATMARQVCKHARVE